MTLFSLPSSRYPLFLLSLILCYFYEFNRKSEMEIIFSFHLGFFDKKKKNLEKPLVAFVMHLSSC